METQEIKKLTLGDFRKMTECLPDDMLIGITTVYEGCEDNWGRKSSSTYSFHPSANISVVVNLGRKEISIAETNY